jgi:3-deoxy-manno-octulosonate cytidylyltransferase (CMP-KDO synthetase)
MMKMNLSADERFAIVIPARYGSTRLPGKPLADILGKPMIQHVYERATAVPGVSAVIVATDDERVAAAVSAFGGIYMMTSPDHSSGTDRLVEVMRNLEADLYINLQGDEPLVRPDDIAYLVEGMRADKSIDVGTLCHVIPAHEAINPNVVKIALTDEGDALYFSRSPIPYPRDTAMAAYIKHIGIYAYRREVLSAYAALPQPMVERLEKLEQLRLLAAGFRIRAFEVAPSGPGVDTLECLDRVRAILTGNISTEPPALANVKLVITDVDGVLTDGGIYYNEDGECIKRFHVRDGLGMRMLEESGVRVAVLSGRDSPTLRKRMSDLKVSFPMFGVKDKRSACLALMAKAGARPEETVCIGDDSIDLPAFAACGISFAVSDAPDYICKLATNILSNPGGNAAFREVADLILNAKGKKNVYMTAEGYASLMHELSQ